MGTWENVGYLGGKGNVPLGGLAGAEGWGVRLRLEDLWGLEDTRGKLMGRGR